jgi:dienelactone hydrolase
MLVPRSRVRVGRGREDLIAPLFGYPNQEGAHTEGEATAITDYRTAVGGIEATLDLLEARGVDVSRVGMGGYSFGAEVTFWVAMHTRLVDVMSVASPTG